MLVEAYRYCDDQSDQLRCTTSVYNTGHPARDIRNGYVERVWSTADQIVPAIRQASHRHRLHRHRTIPADCRRHRTATAVAAY